MEIPNAGMFTVNEYDWTRPAEETLPGGGRRHYAYDDLMRVTDIDVDDPGANAQLHYGYTYDRVDNVRTRQSAAGETVYGYDDLYRLTGVDDPDGQDEAFTYDHVGNRKTAADTAGEWAYNDNNELEGYDDVTFQYDANGNMTEKNAGGVITQFFYNLEDRLERVEDGAGNTIATYYYDPFGRRLWKEVAGTRTYFHYSDEGLVGEYDATGAEVKGYGWKPGGTWSTDPLFMRVGGEYYWYHNDHLGTPQMMTTSSGAVVWKAKYSSFGNATVDSASTVVNPLRFPGQYEDIETRLHWNLMRYYDPEIGKYLRLDPIGIQKGKNHLFNYVSNNPINRYDPTGLNAAVDIFIHTLFEISKHETDVKQKERTEKENERRRKLIDEWRNKIQDCHDLGIAILRQCDDACIQRYPDDDCKRQKCHMNCYEKQFLTHKRFCQWLEDESEHLKKPIPEY